MNSSQNSEYFCLLSGENPELAYYELESIIVALDDKIQLDRTNDSRIAKIKMKVTVPASDELKLIQKLIQRATMVHCCCKSLFQVEFKNNSINDFEMLVDSFSTNSLSNLDPSATFCVRTRRIRNPIGILKQTQVTQDITYYFGAAILKRFPGKKVDLNHPKELYRVIVSKNGLWFGLHIFESLRKIVRKRTARERPFFHPSSMNPILQRTLVNLAAIKEDQWLLDPFCGTGGALLEASRLGIRSVGIEIDRRIVWGAIRNLKSDDITQSLTNLVFGDAKCLGFRFGTISGIVTDPPYGTAASTKGYDLSDLLMQFFLEAKNILSPKSRLVISIPSTVDLEERAATILNASYKKFYQYVHRSLTRKILVFSLH
ncbi:MAG: DNA methyltransferase [Candidatus Hodarchaeales archaeon]|jgi:tRNA (guanine10-N2)-dimethyltransferase